MSRTGVALRPLDTLFCRDARPMTAGTRSRSGLPTPQTWAGALRTHLLKRHDADFESLGNAIRQGASFAEACAAAGAPGWVAALSVRGPWLAEEQGDRGLVPVIEMPRDLRPAADGSLTRMRPRRKAPPGWIPEEPGMLPLWSDTPPKKAGQQMLKASGLREYVAGGVPPATAAVSDSLLFYRETRTGLAIDPDKLTAIDGLLYSTERLRLADKVCFYAEVEWSGGTALFPRAEPLFFGGEGRVIQAEEVRPFAWPEAGGERAALLLLSPAPFRRGWLPDRLPGRLVSAAVGDPVPISGWDLARRGPKPTRFAASAGSVYLCESANGSVLSLCEPGDAQLGYGDFLKGTWNYYE